MATELTALALTAASIGVVHTALGPDHYLPFVAMGKARGWSLKRTGVITLLCGLGHVASSVLLGLAGIALGAMVGRLEVIEAYRGDLAGWAFIAFGLVYCVWGIRRAWQNRPHTHHHHHDGEAHSHEHTHADGHLHVHDEPGKQSITPWVLFAIFFFGPCEPLIPILMYPAAANSLGGLCLVTATFAVATVGTMLTIVLVASLGLGTFNATRMSRYGHALAGLTILVCGVAIKFGL